MKSAGVKVIALAMLVCFSFGLFSVAFTYIHKNPIARNFDEYFSAMEKHRHFQGSVLIVEKGSIVLKKSYKMADYDEKRKNTPSTIFPIASITKQFVATAVMQLYEKKLLKLDDKLSKFIPDFPGCQDITVHNLLTHTSGIDEYIELPEITERKVDCSNFLDIVNLIKQQQLTSEPGTKMSYSNANYLLLGHIVEKISGMSLSEYMKKYIFSPVGMKNTGPSYDGEKKMYTATSYFPFNACGDDYLLRMFYGSGYLSSTVEDLYQWDRALYTGNIVSQDTLKLMFTDYADNYGYGWRMSDTKLGKKVYHDGNSYGFSSYISRYIDKNSTIIILNNRQSTSLDPMDELGNQLEKILAGEKIELPTSPNAININSKTLSEFIGVYRCQNLGLTFSITKEGDGLYIQISGFWKSKLLPLSECNYYIDEYDTTIIFKKENNEVIGFDLSPDNKHIVFADKTDSSPATERETPFKPGSLIEYCGHYVIKDLANNFYLDIERNGSKLYCCPVDQPKYELNPISKDIFSFVNCDVKIEFIRKNGTDITDIHLISGGKKYIGDKK